MYSIQSNAQIDSNKNVKHCPIAPKDFYADSCRYPHGQKAFDDFLKSNLVLPDIVKQKKVKGAVFIEITVDSLGFPTGEYRILEKVSGCDSCHKELLRVLKIIPKWNPQCFYNKECKLIDCQQFPVQIYYEFR